MKRKADINGEALPKGVPMMYVWAVLLAAALGCAFGSYGNYGESHTGCERPIQIREIQQ